MVLTEKQQLIDACDYSEFNALIKVMPLQGFRIPYSVKKAYFKIQFLSLLYKLKDDCVAKNKLKTG